ncbi:MULTISPECIES: metallophosphoesterase family protein [Brevibacillus]|jgi:serine/threonine protein phosphatase 1|uniref:Serine/threonine protein phosphatase n=1 Tax=Brevibacillus aydinogluensis TaxID=927786 RepID=A0AA48RI66_9BACL|nr:MULTISPECIES: metallophosphoesterase family protein [Bacillales]MBR8659360.1 serine/threonine protein phosphatase [Brevibacillus sp. NL20B1]REK64600.1 MAG: serine/threonine protein phosphatase [Brevibacillus sp.]UFJ60062.1 serine/threonine protein phosphatase [Anoxybacillus sediminis]CAJ1003302.1 Serine/threonine protein phosphatase [Brevibacillus aydinogluensis]
MAIYLVSDIHGHYEVLRTALDRVSFSPQQGDRLYVLGDVVDRGPQSREALQYLLNLRQTYPDRIVLIKGNHEQMLQDWLEGKGDANLYLRINGGDATIRSYLGRQSLRRAFLGGLPALNDQESARRYILSRYSYLLPSLASLPLYVEMPADPASGAPAALFVHAGIRPGIPLDQQRPEDLLWIRQPFYQSYRGETVIVFGHTPVSMLPGYTRNGVWRRGNLIGIDGGAASWQGGILLVEWPSLRYVYVPVREVYPSPRIHLR